jgi:outer membrane murein-binding lipoprotein Lpp
MRTRLFLFLAVLVLGTAALGACSKADSDKANQTVSSVGDQLSADLDQFKSGINNASQEVRESAVRNGTAAAAPAEFRRQGYQVDSPMQCSASSPQLGEFTVNCTGTTTDGRAAAVSGTDPAGDSAATFTGTIDGNQVFMQDCIGLC